MGPPHHEKISWSRRDKFQMKKSCPHPTTRKSRGLVVTNSNNIKMLKPLQITPCQIGLPRPYVVGFSAQLYNGMFKCHQLTYNALSNPHSRVPTWLQRLFLSRESKIHTKFLSFFLKKYTKFPPFSLKKYTKSPPIS